MERNDWNERRDYSSNRNRYSSHESRPDENSYRGAYRLDTTSDHRNQSTWDGFDRGGSNRGRQNDFNQDYNRDYNRNYNQDYNRNYNSQESRRNEEHREDRDRNERSRQSRGEYSNRSSYDDGSGWHDSVRNRIQDRDPYGSGNFRGDYSPDNYAGSRGQNYGNMAGSLSFGYDGDRNADFEQYRHYDPLSGRRHSYHGNYETRRPERDQYDNSRNNQGFSNDGWI